MPSKKGLGPFAFRLPVTRALAFLFTQSVQRLIHAVLSSPLNRNPLTLNIMVCITNPQATKESMACPLRYQYTPRQDDLAYWFLEDDYRRIYLQM